jgi:tetratricopeptide (TPR) repeat protein
VKKPQWLTLIVAICLLAVLYLFGKTIPSRKTKLAAPQQSESGLSTDSILVQAKKVLSINQLNRVNELEQSVKRGDVKEQQIKVYHDLARYWKDSIHIPLLYQWYEAEAARLENSEKTLTFAAHMFLDSLAEQSVFQIKQWQAFQAEDLFKRSLKLNPNNDSSKIGLGAVYIYGGISMPMQGITIIKEVADRDATNVYAQWTLGMASLLSGQTEKAIERFRKVSVIQPGNIEAIFRIASLYEQLGNKPEAINWYTRLLAFLKEPESKAIENRIAELKK